MLFDSDEVTLRARRDLTAGYHCVGEMSSRQWSLWLASTMNYMCDVTLVDTQLSV